MRHHPNSTHKGHAQRHASLCCAQGRHDKPGGSLEWYKRVVAAAFVVWRSKTEQPTVGL